jgi:hypothetical protein
MSSNNAPAPPPSTQDALEVLESDHRRLKTLFQDYARLTADGAADADRSGLLARIGALLRAHAQIQTELFYPALLAAGAVRQDDLPRHDALLADLASLAESDVRDDVHDAEFDRRVARLGDKALAHAAQVEKRLFPAARSLDIKTLGTQLALRRGELLGDQGAD